MRKLKKDDTVIGKDNGYVHFEQNCNFWKEILTEIGPWHLSNRFDGNQTQLVDLKI